MFFKPTTEEVEDRFATLRPAQFVARQMQEHKGSDAYREQLQVYKRFETLLLYFKDTELKYNKKQILKFVLRKMHKLLAPFKSFNIN